MKKITVKVMFVLLGCVFSATTQAVWAQGVKPADGIRVSPTIDTSKIVVDATRIVRQTNLALPTDGIQGTIIVPKLKEPAVFKCSDLEIYIGELVEVKPSGPAPGNGIDLNSVPGQQFKAVGKTLGYGNGKTGKCTYYLPNPTSGNQSVPAKTYTLVVSVNDQANTLYRDKYAAVPPGGKYFNGYVIYPAQKLTYPTKTLVTLDFAAPTFDYRKIIG